MTKYAEYMESWYKIFCPCCEQINWICNGNEQDVIGIDIDGVKCLKCNDVFMLGGRDEIEIEINGGEYPAGNWYIVDGKQEAK